MKEINVNERRLIKVLVTYWERLRKGANLPQFESFNSALVEDVWPACFVLNVKQQANKKNYQYLHVGSHVVDAYGHNPQGELITSNIKTIPGAGIVERIDECVDEKIPIVEQGQFVNDNNQVIKYRSCMIPFSKSDDYVDHVIVGLSWREF